MLARGGTAYEPPRVTHPGGRTAVDDPDGNSVGIIGAGEPLEVGVVEDDEGVAVIHAMQARAKFLKGVVDEVSTSRAARSKAIEAWADKVQPGELVVADTESLGTIAELAQRRAELDAALIEAIRSARRSDRPWSEIGAMLGVSKQAAQGKYSKVAV